MKPIFFALLFCIGLALAAPSDLIKHSTGHAAIDLRNVDPSSAKAIDGTNENLTAAKVHEMDDLGRLSSRAREQAAIQTDMGVTATQTAFNNSNQTIPSSIRNSSNLTMTMSNNTRTYD
jgi:hypothetical protein